MWRTVARENTTIPQAEGFPGTWSELLLDVQAIRFLSSLGHLPLPKPRLSKL